ncbi:MAG: tRNA lysidine(34) synthetase TilS [Firmicutes bacterium]|nr:tRNA lysidine(34) synthetase TilS [Bacillota bacterium]
MLKRVVNTIKGYNLINSSDNIIVGVSGGPDSMAMLDVLLKLKDKLNFNLFVAHINHGVREIEADKDELYVKNFCKSNNIPFYSEMINMDVYAKENKLSKEEAGREIRYNFFNELKRKLNGAKIAVAHNKNDQCETLLMRFLRGTGLDGLKGMEYKNGNIIRPLLDISRREIEDYCLDNNLNPRIDKSNLKPIYRRNKIRLELIPYIEKNFNPSLNDALSRTSKIIKRDQAFLEITTKKAFKEISNKKSKKVYVLDIKKFNKLHISIKARVIRYTLEKIMGNLKGIEQKHVESIIELIKENKAGKRINIIKDILIVMRYDKFVIKKRKTKDETITNKRLEINNCNKIKDYNIEVSIVNKNEFNINKKHRFIKYFDYDKIEGGLYVKTRKPGDRFTPLGMKGSKKLKDFFIDEKIPRDKRDSIPLICDDNNIIWIVGFRISELYKVTEATKRFLKIKIDKEDIGEE